MGGTSSPCARPTSSQSSGWVGKFFFFSSRRRHTRYWRDWSSDVCSSDLFGPIGRRPVGRLPKRPTRPQKPKRSEERRVGKECRSWWSRYHVTKRTNMPDAGTHSSDPTVLSPTYRKHRHTPHVVSMQTHTS